MAKRQVEIEAVPRKGGIDVHGCVLALLALARQLQAEADARSGAGDDGEVKRPEDGDV